MRCEQCNDLGFVLQESPLSHIGVHEAVPCSSCMARREARRDGVHLGCYIALGIVLLLFLAICAAAIAVTINK